MLINKNVLYSLTLSFKEEIDPADADVHLHIWLDFFRILFRCTFLLELVEITCTGVLFSPPSDSLSFPDNWDRVLSTAAIIIFSFLYFRYFSYCLILLVCVSHPYRHSSVTCAIQEARHVSPWTDYLINHTGSSGT